MRGAGVNWTLRSPARRKGVAENVTMKNSDRDRDEEEVVAPQERSPQIEKYLLLATSLERSTDSKRLLDVDQLLDMAQERTGAVRLSSESALHFEGLRCLAESIRHDSYYDDLGKRAGHSFVYNWILRFLQFERDLASFPDIVRVPMPKPLFIIGFGRTGSTFLHHLLALDLQVRTPQLWELMEPSPPPRSESYATDARIRKARVQLGARSIVMPNISKIHEYDVHAPEECQHMMWHGPHHAMLGLKGTEYLQWLNHLSESNLRVLYDYYKLQAQHLQLFCRREHWVSKSLSHAHFLPVLFNVFPDARIVRLHRDPCQIVPGLASLIAHLQVVYTRRSDFRELGQRVLQLFVESMNRSMQIDATVAPEHFIDVPFGDLTRNPIGTIREIYAKFGYRYTDQFDRDLHKRLQAGAGRKYRHTYTLERFGLSRAEVVAKSELYLAWARDKTGSTLVNPGAGGD